MIPCRKGEKEGNKAARTRPKQPSERRILIDVVSEYEDRCAGRRIPAQSIDRSATNKSRDRGEGRGRSKSGRSEDTVERRGRTRGSRARKTTIKEKRKGANVRCCSRQGPKEQRDAVDGPTFRENARSKPAVQRAGDVRSVADEIESEPSGARAGQPHGNKRTGQRAAAMPSGQQTSLAVVGRCIPAER